jgi:hypothetical protein
VTIRVRSGQEGIEFRESIRESSADFPIKSGGERGIRTPDCRRVIFADFLTNTANTKRAGRQQMLRLFYTGLG